MIYLTRDQVRRIDRLSTERYKIPGVVLMENAAREAADVACAMMRNDCLGEVMILCGGGNNGGDGLALARHLHNRGADVEILLTADPARYAGEAKANWDIVQAMALPTEPADPAKIEAARPLLLVDAAFGTGLTQPPRDPFGDIVRAIRKSQVLVLAIDIPSGLDCDTGKPLGPCIQATRTITFVAAKIGFAQPEAARFLGELSVGDIGCPMELIHEVTKPDKANDEDQTASPLSS